MSAWLQTVPGDKGEFGGLIAVMSSMMPPMIVIINGSIFEKGFV
jgi:hypothetical protein